MPSLKLQWIDGKLQWIDGKEDELKAAPAFGKPVETDTVGFTAHALDSMRAHLKQSGCRGIEFVPDKKIKGFYNVRADNRGAMAKYLKSRESEDFSGSRGAGAMLSPGHLEKVKAILQRKNN